VIILRNKKFKKKYESFIVLGILGIRDMTNNKTPPFNPYYSAKLTKLCPSIKWSIWKSLMTGKYPMPEEQASGIDPEIEKKLDYEIMVYQRKKQRQRQSPIENLSHSYNMEKNTQTENTNVILPMCDHEKEINRR